MDCQKNTTYFIKMVKRDKYSFKSKEKPKHVKKKKKTLTAQLVKRKQIIKT